MLKRTRRKPRRSYRDVIEHLRQVWTIQEVDESDAIWSMGTAEQDAFPADGLRLAVWNMCKGAGGRLFEHDYRSLCYRADILLAQEALLSRRSMRVFCERGFQAQHGAAYMRRDGLRDGVMTASRVGSIGKSRRIVCKYPEPVFKTPKVALVSFFPWSDRSETLMVINLHATLIRGIQGAREEVDHLLRNLPDHDGPILFAGDFNTFTKQYLKSIERVLGAIDLEYVPLPEDPRPRTQALDQVFIRGMKVRSAQVDTTVKNSDHFPLLLTLDFV